MFVRYKRGVEVRRSIILLGVVSLLFSCASFKGIYKDDDIYAELEINNLEYIVLYIMNNTDTTIQIISDKSYYSSGSYNSILIPNEKRYMMAGAIIPPINVPPRKKIGQEFVVGKAIKYDKNEFDGISNWTPRSEEKLQNAYFDFEYQINGITKHLIFNGSDLKKMNKL